VHHFLAMGAALPAIALNHIGGSAYEARTLHGGSGRGTYATVSSLHFYFSVSFFPFGACSSL